LLCRFLLSTFCFCFLNVLPSNLPPLAPLPARRMFAVLWLDLFRQLSYQWETNDQYAYG
jgi:hypothetical protein